MGPGDAVRCSLGRLGGFFLNEHFCVILVLRAKTKTTPSSFTSVSVDYSMIT